MLFLSLSIDIDLPRPIPVQEVRRQPATRTCAFALAEVFIISFSSSFPQDTLVVVVLCNPLVRGHPSQQQLGDRFVRHLTADHPLPIIPEISPITRL